MTNQQVKDGKCPNCGLWNHSSAIRCDCGYAFQKIEVEGRADVSSSQAQEIENSTPAKWGPIQYISNTFRNCGDFSGRARRSEYWWFFLFNVVMRLIIGALEDAYPIYSDYGPLFLLYALVVLIPTLAVTVRRLHDTGRSGLWLLVGFLPVIGAIILLMILIEDGDPEENRYGQNPKCDVNHSKT